ncbi:hypothetical protein BHM03_00038805, partial [Ensete ventricosum]
GCKLAKHSEAVERDAEEKTLTEAEREDSIVGTTDDGFGAHGFFRFDVPGQK